MARRKRPALVLPEWILKQLQRIDDKAFVAILRGAIINYWQLSKIGDEGLGSAVCDMVLEQVTDQIEDTFEWFYNKHNDDGDD